MVLELQQHLKLSQQLVMTPQLQQAIKLLQLSRIELAEIVQQELEENPFLEEIEHLAQKNEGVEAHKEMQNNEELDMKSLLQLNTEWEDYLGEFSSTAKQAKATHEVQEDVYVLEARNTTSDTLSGHLLWQLHLSKLSKDDIEIGEYIIGNLSNTGYFDNTVEEVACALNVAVEDVERVLHLIQRFDPIGIAARSIRECLLIQLEVLRYDRDPILVAIIKDHLENLEQKKYKTIIKKVGISMEDLKEYLDIICMLDPKPGASFTSDDTMYIVPDIYVYQYNNDFHIILNEDGLPNVQLSNAYSDTIFNSTNDSEKQFLQDKIRSASWLIRSLHQRQRTLHRVMESILRHQRAFFEEGPTKLKPLVLRDIADDTGMHESTVSRITTNKFVATAHGIYELKYFFNSAIEIEDGNQIGSESVKALIKKFITEEDSKNPLSDEKIVELLKEELHIQIARRTVAKYRIALNIPSSLKRKTFF